MIKASKFAIAIAVVAPVGIATAGESLAAPVPPSAMTAKAPAPTEVQYRTYFDYGYGPYAYRPASDTEATRTGIPATGIGRIPATTTTTGGKRLSPALKALAFSACSTTSVPAGNARRDWAPTRVVRLPFNAVG